jgi:hypothetical protein
MFLVESMHDEGTVVDLVIMFIVNNVKYSE